MTLDDLYTMLDEIEKEKKWLFVVYDKSHDEIGIDVLEWETEDAVDGGWFKSVQEVAEFVINNYKENDMENDNE